MKAATAAAHELYSGEPHVSNLVDFSVICGHTSSWFVIRCIVSEMVGLQKKTVRVTIQY